jgi:hypothetical protein
LKEKLKKEDDDLLIVEEEEKNNNEKTLLRQLLNKNCNKLTILSDNEVKDARSSLIRYVVLNSKI